MTGCDTSSVPSRLSFTRNCRRSNEGEDTACNNETRDSSSLSSPHTQTLNEASANGTNHELQTLLAEVTTLASLEATGFFLNG